MDLLTPIPCKICGKTFIRMGAHVKTHGLSLENYRSQYGDTRYIDRIIRKINNLFITRRDKWGHAYRRTDSGSYGYRTNDASKNKVSKTPFLDRNLIDKDIARHLRGGTAAVINTPNGYSKWLCFDLDAKTEEGKQQAIPIARNLIQNLSQYFQSEGIHLEHSGGKGYHVWIFFDHIVPIEDLLAFAKHVTQFNQGNTDLDIEFRPESANGKGVKLPLGIHNKTGNFCAFLNKETFERIDDQYEYLLSINPISWIQFKDPKENPPTMPKTVATEPKISHIKMESCGAEHLARIWEKGLPGPGTRNRYTFPLAIWLKEQGLSQEETVAQLISFTDREHLAGRTKDSGEASQKDIASTVRNVFERNLTLRETELTEFDHAVIALQDSKLQKTMQAIYQLARLGHQNGYFYLSREYIGKMIGKNPVTVWRHLAKLEDRHLFRTHTGTPAKDLAAERKEMLGPLLEENPDLKELANFFFNPESGENSLYFLPTLKPLYFEKFIRLPATRLDKELLEMYSRARYALDFILWRNQYAKYRIIENGGRPFSVEEEERMRQWAGERKDYFFSVNSWMYSALIMRIENHFCGGEDFKWDFFTNDPLLAKAIRELELFKKYFIE